MADYFDLLKTRRSIRDFKEKNVPLEIIREIIKESCLAPSSGNGQPWRFIIVNDRALIKRLSDESKKNLISYIETNPDAAVRKYEDTLRNNYFNVFYNAPCLIYILGLKEIGSVQIDCALAASYLMFSAAARGLGTCWGSLWANIFKILGCWKRSACPKIARLWHRSLWVIQGASQTYLKEWSLRSLKQSLEKAFDPSHEMGIISALNLCAIACV